MSGNSLLLRALRMNAIFSAISALIMLSAGGWIAAQLGLGGATVIYIVAGMLLLFALQLGNIVRTDKIRRWEIISIIGGDIAWILGSAVFIALFYRSMTTTGLWLVDSVAVVVLYFAVQQIRGLQALRLTAGTARE